MEPVQIVGILLALLSIPLIAVVFLIQYRQITRDYKRRRDQLDREHREWKERHKKRREALDRYHAHQHRVLLNLGVNLSKDSNFTPSQAGMSPPSEEDMALLTESGIISPDYSRAFQGDIDALHRDWLRVGQTLCDVVDAAPDPADCEGLTPDEFEAIIRQRLDERRNRGDS